MKPGLSQFQGPFECCDSRIKQILLCIQAAKREVIQGEFSMETQANGFQVSGAGLGLGAARFDGLADPAPYIGLIRNVP